MTLTIHVCVRFHSYPVLQNEGCSFLPLEITDLKSTLTEENKLDVMIFPFYAIIPAAELHIHLLRNLAAEDILPQVGFPLVGFPLKPLLPSLNTHMYTC